MPVLWKYSQLQSKHPNSHHAANVARYKTPRGTGHKGSYYYFYGWVVTKEILQRYLSSIDRTLGFYDDEIGSASSAIFYMQRDWRWSCGKLQSGPEWSRLKKGRCWVWCQLVALGRRGYFGVVQRPSSWSDSKRFLGRSHGVFEKFYTKEEFELDLMH